MHQRDYDDLQRAAENFRSRLEATASQHMSDGEDHLAGELLVLERRVYRSVNGWSRGALSLLPAPALAAVGDAPASVPTAAKHRHDFRGPNGEESSTCLECGQERKPNGRPRKQQLIPAVPAPAPAPALPGGK